MALSVTRPAKTLTQSPTWPIISRIGPLSNPTTAVQCCRRERLFMPHSGHPPDRHGQGVRHANEQLSPPAAQLRLAIKDQFRALPAAGMISGGGCGTFACRGSGAAVSSSTCEGCPLAIWRWPLSFRSFEALPSSQSSTASTAFPRRSLGACSVYDRAGRARRRCGALSTLFGRGLRRFGAKPDKKIVDSQAAIPSSWKRPFIPARMAW